MADFIEAGKAAPAFTLQNQEGEKIKLSDFKDKNPVVIYFYPKAMTPGCTKQACGFRDSSKEIQKRGVRIFGVSPDPVDRLKKFEEKEGLKLGKGFDLLSDEDHKIAEKYGAWGKKKSFGKESVGIKRSTFIVGKDGKVKHVMPKVNTSTHHEDVLAWIDENLDD